MSFFRTRKELNLFYLNYLLFKFKKVKKNKIYLVKNKNVSHQLKNNNHTVGDTIEPPMAFEVLTDTYSENSLISWIIWKIATKTNTPFEKTDSEQLDKILENLDIENIVINLLVYGNCYLERLKTLNWQKTLEFEEIITETVKLSKKDWIFLNQKWKNDLKWVDFEENDILFFKRNSLVSKKYWDSLFANSVNEIILLTYITKYFKKFFSNWNINPTILFDENKELDDEQMSKIESLINDKISWIENSNSTIIIQWKMGKIDLSTIFDPEKYISLKRELKEDIAIDMNIPFDLLSSESSNRATSQTAMEALYSNIIIPLQDRLVSQLKKQFLKWFRDEKWNECWNWISEENILKISFLDINLKNPKDEMETLVWYLKNWVLSVNEVREKALLWEAIEDGDDYRIISWNSITSKEEEEEIEKIKNNIKDMYLWNK